MPKIRNLFPTLLIGMALGASTPTSQPDRQIAKNLAEAALKSRQGFEGLKDLCDRIGPRLSGSPQLDQAIQWAKQRMEAAGFQNVHTEPVMVPVWVRGHEEAEVLAPMPFKLSMLGLGMSVGTPAAGITAEVVAVTSFQDLDRLGASAKGKVVVFDQPFTSYSEAAEYRESGASKAAKYGAVAVLVRSVTPVSLATPHTGSVDYEDGVPQIPAACVSVENAAMLHRLCDRGEKPVVRLKMEAKRLADAPSANVVGEIPGKEHAEEIVLLGAHLDSWDVGQGAQDDGVGCMIAIETARLLKAQGIQPTRTIRVVLFTNEENGCKGAQAYLKAHAAELPLHVAALEADAGNGLAKGFRLDLRGQRGASREAKHAILARLQAVSPMLQDLGAPTMALGKSEADVEWLVAKGVPGLALDQDTSLYFEVHHTWADTVDKVIPEDLARNTAMMAVMTYALACGPKLLAR